MKTAVENIQEKRFSKRFKLDRDGALYDTNFDRLPIKMIDISTTGMKVAGVDLIADQEIIIEWEDIEIEAKVAWAIGEAAGIQFDQELEKDHVLLRIAN